MKKFLLFLLLFMCCLTSTSSQSLSGNQQKLKKEIFQYLSKFASNLNDYAYNMIVFDYLGTRYVVSISESDHSPLMVTLTSSFSYPDTYKDEILTLACADVVNNIKAIKCVYTEEYVVFASEMYLTESKTFTSVIFKLIEGIQNGKTHFEERYDYHRSMNKGVSNPNMNTGEFYFPTRVSTGNDSKLYISKVTLDKSFTKVDFISYNNRSTTYCGIGRNTYLLAGGRKYMLNKAVGISFIPDKTEYPNWKSGMDVSLAFTLYFEPLPLETTSFDFIENAVEIGTDWSGDGWRINGVKLQRSGWINVEGGSKIETSHHSWEALAVQLQDGQTVVRKCVTPKDNGTYMFSSYDEFIEDADTGRKYYLRNSSIGFKHNSLISYDRDPIDFSEVYPELPQNVKRIHISSGSQYYVRDLIIR